MPSIFIRIDKYDELLRTLEKAMDDLDKAERLVQQLEDVHTQEAEELERMKHDLHEAGEKTRSLHQTLKSLH